MDQETSYYHYSSNYSNDNGTENTSTREVISKDGKIAKVYETTNDKLSTYQTDLLTDVFKPSLPFFPEFHFDFAPLKYLSFSKNKKNTTTSMVQGIIIIILLLYIFYLRYCKPS